MKSLFNNADDGANDRFFKEEFELDFTDENESSKINVPDFRDGRTGRFLHDFKSNQTAIIDENNKRCFVMPLDRTVILPPKSFADLIQKMYGGYYDINTTEVRKNMRVVLPAMVDLSSVSQKIQDACSNMELYQLEKYVGGIFKRSISELPDDAKFAGFFGKGVVSYNLINRHQMK